MEKKERQVKASYIYDRFWEQKLSQVYHLLVPPTHCNNIPGEQSTVELIKHSAYEDSSDIYESVLDATEGG